MVGWNRKDHLIKIGAEKFRPKGKSNKKIKNIKSYAESNKKLNL